jgi:HEAT repeat protein
MGEVRNLNLIADTTDHALEAIFKVFEELTSIEEYDSGRPDLVRKMVSAIHPISDNWPNRMKLAALLKNFKPTIRVWAYNADFGEFVGIVGQGVDGVRDELIGYANSSDVNLRSLWPEALARGWIHDPLTIELLKKQSLNDPLDACRSPATAALGRHLAVNPENISFMRDKLENDSDGTIRYEALVYLYKARDTSSIHLFVKHLSDSDFLVRYAAVSALTKYLDNEEVFATLLDKAAEEPVDWLKNMFYATLTRARREDPRVYDLLLNRAVNDEDEFGRLNTLELLAEHFRQDLKVRDLLLARANDDSSAIVRRGASELLAGNSVKPHRL